MSRIRGENAITVVAGANALASADQVPDDLLSSSTTVLLQFETPPAESLALAVRAKLRGARVVLNTAPFSALDPSWLASIDVLIANEHEAAALAGELELPEDADAFAAATAARYGIATIVTLGSKGAIAATPSDSLFRAGTPGPVHRYRWRRRCVRWRARRSARSRCRPAAGARACRGRRRAGMHA